MFDFVRTHQRLMQFILLLFIFPSFAFVGIEGYQRFNDDANVIAKVGGQTVTRQEFENAQREQAERMRQMFGAQFDQKMLETPEARKNIIDGLVAQKALAVEAANNRLAISDQTLQQRILEIPGLVGPDGKFNNEQYKALLAMQGMTPASFEARMRQDLLLQQANAAIQSTAITPKTVATRLSELNDQEREVQELAFRAADFVSQVKVTDEMVKAYYDKNASQFEIPEMAKAEYLVLSLDAVAAQIAVSDDDVKTYYENNKQRYGTDEQRRASHILIAARKDAPAAEKSAAKAKAESLLAQLRKNPADFAKLAKENSQDPGSAERGGDLDFFSKGMMTKPFEEAAYKLKEGEISNVVETDFGYHIIQVTAIKPSAVKPLEEVKAEIVAEIRKQQAGKKFGEMAETFTNTVYEQSDSLKPAADKLKLEIRTAANLTRNPNPALGPAPFNHEKFLKALFSDDAIKNKRNTEAVEVAPNTLIAGRIVEHKPTTRRPLEEVKDVVRERVTQEQAAAMAKKAGEEKLAAVRAKDDASGFGEPKMVSRSKPADLGGKGVSAVMKADSARLPAYVGVDYGVRGYAIYRVNKVVQPANPDAARRQAEYEQIAGAQAQQETLSYIEAIKVKAKAKVTQPAAAAPADEAQGDAKTK